MIKLYRQIEIGQKHFFYPYFLVMLQKLRLKKFLRNGND